MKEWRVQFFSLKKAPNIALFQCKHKSALNPLILQSRATTANEHVRAMACQRANNQQHSQKNALQHSFNTFPEHVYSQRSRFVTETPNWTRFGMEGLGAPPRCSGCSDVAFFCIQKRSEWIKDTNRSLMWQVAEERLFTCMNMSSQVHRDVQARRSGQ